MNKDQIIFKNLLLGSFLASLSAALGGSTFVFTRILVDSVDPFTLSFLRYGLTGLILFLLSINIFYKKKFDRFDLIPMSLLGLAMISLFPNFMALGLEHTTASRAGLLYATMPLCTIIIAFFFKIEKITTNKSLAVVIAISGVLFCMSERVEGNFGETLKGDLLMMIGVIAASCFTVFSGKYLKKYGNVPVMVFVIFVGSVINLFVALILGTGLENSYEIGHLEVITFLMLIIPGGVLMMFCWGKALQLISPTQAAISLGFNPLSAILLGYIILNEQITFKLMIGFVSIIFAIVLANWKSSKS
jgi:drug/metabolite transporter (DMT)-like permease